MAERVYYILMLFLSYAYLTLQLGLNDFNMSGVLLLKLLYVLLVSVVLGVQKQVRSCLLKVKFFLLEVLDLLVHGGEWFCLESIRGVQTCLGTCLGGRGLTNIGRHRPVS